MVTADLLIELQARGVTLKVQNGQLLTTAPKGAITADLALAIREQKATLLLALQEPINGGGLVPLPEQLTRLVGAAVGEHLNHIGFLPSGMVMNLGEYVLAAAALYATGSDPQLQLNDLWAAYGVWRRRSDF